MNFILKEGLEKKKVTFFLSNVSAEEALDILTSIKDVSYRRIKESNNYIVEPKPKGP